MEQSEITVTTDGVYLRVTPGGPGIPGGLLRLLERIVAETKSRDIWLVLLNVETGQASTQRSLAAALRLREPTLSHHLAAMESDGLITRHRDDANRRVQVVALTDEGRVRFGRLREAAIAFDRELRRGIDDADLALVDEILARLAGNVS